MRSLAPLLLLLAGLVPLRAQWQIFAEKLPAPGTWASFRMETLRDGKVVSTGDLRFSVRPGRAATAARASEAMICAARAATSSEVLRISFFINHSQLLFMNTFAHYKINI